MAASYLPSILVPLIGIIFPGLSMALFFLYIEQDSIS
uniref:Photosystem I reaction center subunit VIII n=1 Tax=Cliftonaea pectinata TaxID=2007206 RepID=A0A1Z1MR19_9FLOR|nr:photosystem I reaction center subunit VIII [Cliftonaea pectinata]ARW68184.1 photosystem I reaction center subunit VIII [Cliftonaea pectinata]